MRLFLTSLALCAAAIPLQAHAWGNDGHMAVAAVAWSHMSPAARAHAAALLKRNPDYAAWIAGVAPQDQDRVAFMHAATWPDSIKSNKAYKDDGYTPADPHAGDMGDYADMVMHKGWHFIDMPFSPDGTPTEPPFATNAVTQITKAEANLGSASASDLTKSYSLNWLLHLVGDIHQPLHATSRYTAAFPHGDVGGNSVHACLAKCEKGDNLHKFWDDLPGRSNAVAAVDHYVSSLSPADPANVSVQDPAAWASESEKLAESKAYAAPIGVTDKVYHLTRTYAKAAAAVAAVRVELAGERLAAILNATL